jgi:hypothetical protein
MNSTIQQQVLDKLDILAAKLGVAAKALFLLYVRQAYIEGIENTLSCLFLFTLSYIFYRSMLSFYEKAKKEYSSDGFWAGTFLCAAGCLITVFIGGNILNSAIDCLANPNLYAFQLIVSNLK